MPAAQSQGLMLLLIGGPGVKIAGWPAIRKGLKFSATSFGLVVWPSSAAGPGDKAHIVRALQEISGQAPRVCAPPGSANRGGYPKGHATATMVLGPFAETKGLP
ncbi:MAG TPA: hypothetical protein DD706_24695 [Nitrospiraceae bacterium]|nr:hypothetical protein [Nitrospiraceae bacterium]